MFNFFLSNEITSSNQAIDMLSNCFDICSSQFDHKKSLCQMPSAKNLNSHLLPHSHWSQFTVFVCICVFYNGILNDIECVMHAYTFYLYILLNLHTSNAQKEITCKWKKERYVSVISCMPYHFTKLFFKELNCKFAFTIIFSTGISVFLLKTSRLVKSGSNNKQLPE